VEKLLRWPSRQVFDEKDALPRNRSKQAGDKDMSAKPNADGTTDPILKPFYDLWSDCYTKSNDVTREFLEDVEESTNVRSWQRRWNDAVAKSADAFMRSPTFLQAMKQNTDAMVKFKQQADDLSKEIARNANIPTTSDISGLFERLHSVEEVILERLRRIEDRLEAIESHTGIDQLAAANKP
jgi:hypothetical protein